jgi:hypothetical protein
MSVKKSTNGVSEQMKRSALLKAIKGITRPLSRQATSADAVNAKPKVAAIRALSTVAGRSRFIAIAQASETTRRINPVLVKYNSANSPS